MFLGAPFNIASYALLLELLSAWTGLKPGMLSGTATDAHLYVNHLDGVQTYMDNVEHKLPTLVLPERAKLGLEECLGLTALDFSDSLTGYEHEGSISVPLSVG